MSDPDTFLPVPHWGRHGGTYIQLATVEEPIFRDVLRRSWRQIAPILLVAGYFANGKLEKHLSSETFRGFL